MPQNSRIPLAPRCIAQAPRRIPCAFYPPRTPPHPLRALLRPAFLLIYVHIMLDV